MSPPASPAPPTTAALHLQGVTKSYRQPGGDPLPVLDIESFRVDSGEQLALVGPSGTGKTTLLNVVAGITPVDSGEVRVGGTDIARLPEPIRDRFRAERIGIVFQSFNLLSAFTALENVLLGMAFSRTADRSRAADLLDAVGLADRRDYRPAALSVGQQQRVAVARALANSPQLMIADEPTASVDLANQERIVSLIRERCRADGVALVVITHDESLAAEFDRRVELAEINRAVAVPA